MMKKFQQSGGVDLTALSAFLAVAGQRSFRAAAAELNITPSAISHTIKALEQRLNARLFNRTTRSVSLTDAGERLAGKLRPAMASIEEAILAVDDDLGVPRGTIRINASDGAIRLVLQPVLARFLRMYPQVHLDIVSDGRLGDIVSEGFDAGIRLTEAVPKDMVAVTVTAPMRFAAVASPAYLERRGRPRLPLDLHQHDCIRFRFESGALYRWEFEKRGVSERINVDGPITLSDQPLMVDAAIDGIGIAFVPEHLAAEGLADGRLERLLYDWCPEFPGLSLYYPGHRHVPPALRALIALIHQKGPGARDG
ncbi:MULTISPECIES: LysR family transcriptional regulator [Stenotrophomonas]|uniref:LysR family transcriptional regulator n=2 Tax=Stenotrophomonas TaxID=40323 RepID=UPI000B7577A0|nr:LysR family transcriptional regulator [Stenotrophomonas maltophilia]SMR76299.1 transcriptional regulator, LysR family [Stenotrophomonas sp. yr243]SNS65958.1 transcriptional regulator, LysR family [Stenotrophomonas lactitubi]